MTVLAEKLREAGADTLGAQLATACTVAARLHPGNPEAAWQSVGVAFGHGFIRGIMAEMSPSPPRLSPTIGNIPPYKPRVISAERAEATKRKLNTLKEIVRSRYKTSDGRLWGNITPHEAMAMQRDGLEATPLLAALPANIPNDGRDFSEHLGWDKVNEILAHARMSPA